MHTPCSITICYYEFFFKMGCYMFLQEHGSRSRGLDSYYGAQQSMQGMV